MASRFFTIGTLTVLTVAGSMQTFSGLLQDGAGTMGLNVTAPGGVTLTAANTYSGTTAVVAATLQLSNTAALQNSTLVTGGIRFDIAGAGSNAFIFGGLGGAGNFSLSDTANNPVALSVGVATQVPTSDVTPDSLLGQADQALYAAKRLGRNRVTSSDTMLADVACFIAAKRTKRAAQR